MPEEKNQDERVEGQVAGSVPTISLPKGGGAIRGMGEKFAANPVTGTGSMSVPIAVSPGRSGFAPQLSLSYDSGSGNGPFGLGWSLSLPAITRKTDRGLPQYDDANESDVFLLSGAEDLVPVLVKVGSKWQREVLPPRAVGATTFRVERYRPRVEGLFARIERWTNTSDSSDTFWRSISKDNVTTFYGRSPDSRICDPADSTRVFSWLICESHDDKGNAMAYNYKAEDGAGIDLIQPCERNRGARNDPRRAANRYLKRIRYGNTAPFFPASVLEAPPTDWLFEVVLDYGEHDAATPTPNDAGEWACRLDPFSVYRSGFDVRTYRLCRRFLMFHHFPDEVGVGNNCLVRSTDLEHSSVALPSDAENLIFSYLLSVTQAGYKRQAGGYIRAALPPLEFAYSRATIQSELRELDPESGENLPVGLDGTDYRWLDLDGDGLSGVLTEQAGAWFYKRNTSPTNRVPGDGARHLEARFAPLETVAAKPTLALADGRAQFMDLAGNGRPDLVTLEGPAPGFYQRSEDVAGWENFRPFRLWPNVDSRDPNLKFIDLDGDGHADILVTEEQVLRWHPALAEEGFGPARWVHQALDEEKGPRLVFADGTQSIYAADMSGDGLTDLVRIRNGEVCYWPNLGYGRFGAKVTMGGSPWFDAPDLFDHRRVQLADIDGSGVTDIVYLHGDGIRLYFNQSGNSWSAPRVLPVFPRTDSLTSVTVVDLFGDGTACLVWSSPLSRDARRPMRYLDLIGGTKPHLLTQVANNLGAQTLITYAPSTRFYLQDRENGTPWVTRLPFPVHVVERVETYDRISRNRFVTRHAYHHGYFDGAEREFRGFGMVEQWDTEEFAALTADGATPQVANEDAASHVPPVLTRTWFHTGAFLERGRISRQFEREYYGAPAPDDPSWATFAATLLPDTVLPAGLMLEEEREACRALKGSMLRQEVYALDGTAKQEHPYTVTEQDFAVRVLQPRGENRHGVFLTHARESIAYHTERVPTDPRVGHTLTLEVDDFGNVLQAAVIGYGRRATILADDGQGHLIGIPNPGLAQLDSRDQESQTQILITYTANRVTSPVEADDAHRAPLPCQVSTYELTGLSLQTNCDRFTFDEVLTAAAGASDIDYEADPTPTLCLQKRTIECVRTYYRRNDLNGPLSLGEVESLALPFETYKLVFTPGLLAQVYGGRVTGAMLENDGRYVHTEGDSNWWIPSGRVFYSQNTSDTPAQELAFAKQHFFLPHRYRDPFHTSAVSTETTVTCDNHDLLMVETCDALGNRVAAENDYRVLQPWQVMAPNRNRTQVAFDALGMVVGTAVMGKPGQNVGDSFDGFHVDLTETAVTDYLADPLANAGALLGCASTRLVYDLFAYHRTRGQPNPQPAVVSSLARETHVADLEPGELTKVQHSFSYSDGFGREIQKKIRAEAGPVPARGTDGKVVVGSDNQPQMTANDVSPRWVGSDWTVFNNKGKPVRKYEPFFTDTHRFEFDVCIGVSPILFYDPLGRVVATLHPNHTYEKVVFDAWQQVTYDVNDTCAPRNAETGDPRTDPDVLGYVAAYFADLSASQPPPVWETWYAQRIGEPAGDPDRDAAEKAAAHADTPTTAHFDALGRPFMTVARNRVVCAGHTLDGTGEAFLTRVHLDIEGNEREVVDALDRVVMRYDYSIAGPPEEKEGGEKKKEAPANCVHQASMEAGARWTLNDVVGKPIYSWDSRGHRFRTAYDPLRRPTGTFLDDGTDAEKRIGRTVYGETRPNPEAHNLRGKVVELYDQAGVVTSEEYDFKGNLLRSQRQLAEEHKATLDWSGTVTLDESEFFASHTRYDALNRVTQVVAPHSNRPGAKINVSQPTYNEASLLERVDVWLDRATEPATPLDPAVDAPSPVGVTGIDYDAKGQRRRIVYGNGVTTTTTYDPLTFRLVRLLTTRDPSVFPDDCPQSPVANWPGCQVQDLHYAYDPAGNITSIRDDAQQTIYFRNLRVEPSAEYTYDAVYRLIGATGREHLGQAGGAPIPHSYNDGPRVGILHPGDGHAMGRYIERYVYDAVGNFLTMQHYGSDPANPAWVRAYSYNETSQLELNKVSNRLSSTTVGGTTETYSAAGDGYDAHGDMLHMPQLQEMRWDFKDELQMTQRQAVNPADTDGVAHTGERTWYVYDASGERARKVTERQAGAGQTPTRMKERIYLGGLEIYREYDGSGAGVTIERETLHVMDDKQRIALVETRTQGADPAPHVLIRYQFGNHLGSASLELDHQAQIITYEEYTPYGSTAYHAVRSQTETPKRYRYTGKERDEESGLEYHKARYYAAWLGRWAASDPLATEYPRFSPYVYALGNPNTYSDPGGKGPEILKRVRGGKYKAAINFNLNLYPGKGVDMAEVLADLYALYGKKQADGKPIPGGTFKEGERFTLDIPFAKGLQLTLPGYTTYDVTSVTVTVRVVSKEAAQAAFDKAKADSDYSQNFYEVRASTSRGGHTNATPQDKGADPLQEGPFNSNTGFYNQPSFKPSGNNPNTAEFVLNLIIHELWHGACAQYPEDPAYGGHNSTALSICMSEGVADSLTGKHEVTAKDLEAMVAGVYNWEARRWTQGHSSEKTDEYSSRLTFGRMATSLPAPP